MNERTPFLKNAERNHKNKKEEKGRQLSQTEKERKNGGGG